MAPRSMAASGTGSAPGDIGDDGSSDAGSLAWSVKWSLDGRKMVDCVNTDTSLTSSHARRAAR